jgi:class 3 adenylate cyclase
VPGSHRQREATAPTEAFDSAVLREPDLGSSRRARLTRFLTIAGATLAVIEAGWASVFALAGFGLGVVVCASFALFAVAVVVLARRGRTRLAGHLLLWLCVGATWSVVVLFEPPHPTLGRSAHLWFVPVLVGIHFVLLDASAWTRAFYAAVCIASFVLVALASPAIPAMAPVTAAMNRWAFPATILAALVTTVVLLRLFVADIVDAEARLGRANARIEDLLENMLPRSVARRLRLEGRTFADGYAQCSILFADIVGFTTLSEQIPPAAVVARLNAIFSCFDELAEARGLEKIKTIGDAYMIASGIPEPRADHASALAGFALDALAAVRRFDGIHLRIGINSGAVVAGVIGRKRFVYDLWGDAVNVAERMEEYGLPDRIQVTRATRDLVADEFDLEPRGHVAVRGHHDVEAFLLLGRRQPSAAARVAADGCPPGG